MAVLSHNFWLLVSTQAVQIDLAHLSRNYLPRVGILYFVSLQY